MKRANAIALALCGLLAGCEMDSETSNPIAPSPVQPPPPPPPRPAASTCIASIDDYADRYNGRFVYNNRYQNDCSETIILRVSATLDLLPHVTVHDRLRSEVRVPANSTRWLCGNGQRFNACTFHNRDNINSSFRVRTQRSSCYLDESCSYPNYPD